MALLARKKEVHPDDVPHQHVCPKCGTEWEHTPNQAWAQGRWESHTCPKPGCGEVQFTPKTEEHDVFQ